MAGPDRPHHADLAEVALAALPPELRALLETHREAFRRGALDPDGITDPSKEVNTFYHTWEPSSEGGGGVYRVELSLHEATMALRENRSGEDVAYQMGFLTHFVMDLAVPFHTGDGLYDHAWHEPYEQAAYDHRHEYEVTLEREPREVHDPSAHVKELAERSAAMAAELVAALDASGGAWTPEAREITRRAASLGAQATADLLYTAWVRADPSRPAPTFDANMPIPREPEDVGLSIAELRKHHPWLLVSFFAALAALALGAVVMLLGRKRRPSG